MTKHRKHDKSNFLYVINDLADELATNNNPKPFWSFVKSMRKGSNNLVSLNVDGVTLSNDLNIVESMNDFFSSVFTSEDCDQTSPNLNMSPIVNFQTFFVIQRK